MGANPLIIAHRGASAFAPENTIAAFKLALACGADGIEFDVQLAADGVPVIIHDPNLLRTGQVNRLVRDVASSELGQIDVGSWFARERRLPVDEFARETVPTLDQLFDLCAETTSLLYLEMKCEASDQTALVDACVEAILRKQFSERVIVESFGLSSIRELKAKLPATRTAALFEPKLSMPNLFSGQHLVNLAKEVNADEAAIHYRLASRRRIEKLQQAGLRVVVWTVDSTDWIDRAQELGVDAIITNDPIRMLKRRQSTRIEGSN